MKNTEISSAAAQALASASWTAVGFESVVAGIKASMVNHGYIVEEANGGWTWRDCFEDTQDGYQSELAAWLGLIAVICVRADVDPVELSRLAPEAQAKRIQEVALVSVKQRGIQELQKRWGAEHDFYTQEDWRVDTAKGDTKLGYWDWVAHNIVSHGGEEEHCACGHPLDDNEGYNGECGSCADKTFEAESAKHE